MICISKMEIGSLNEDIPALYNVIERIGDEVYVRTEEGRFT